jgi:hypothetical protein
MNYKIELIILLIALLLALRGIGLSVSSLVSSLIGGIFNGKKQHWAMKYFKNNSNVDLKRVTAFVKNAGLPPEDFTAWEMVAAFGLIVSDSTVSETLRVARTWGDIGWEKKYDYDFFDVLEQTAQNVSWKYKSKDSIKLLQFGQRLAQQYDQGYWDDRYTELIEKEYSSRNALKWDSSRRSRP